MKIEEILLKLDNTQVLLLLQHVEQGTSHKILLPHGYYIGVNLVPTNENEEIERNTNNWSYGKVKK